MSIVSSQLELDACALELAHFAYGDGSCRRRHHNRSINPSDRKKSEEIILEEGNFWEGCIGMFWKKKIFFFCLKQKIFEQFFDFGFSKKTISDLFKNYSKFQVLLNQELNRFNHLDASSQHFDPESARHGAEAAAGADFG